MATTNFHAHAFYIKYYHGREIMFLSEFCMGVFLSVVRIPHKISKIDCILGKFEWKLDGKQAMFVLIFRQGKRNAKLAYCISYAQYMNRQSRKSCDFTARYGAVKPTIFKFLILDLIRCTCFCLDDDVHL